MGRGVTTADEDNPPNSSTKTRLFFDLFPFAAIYFLGWVAGPFELVEMVLVADPY